MKTAHLLNHIFLIFIFLTFSSNIQAQLVNIEKSREDGSEGFQGHIDLNLMLAQNTKQIFETGTSAYLQYTMKNHMVLVLNNIGLMRVEGDNLVNNGFQHLRYNYTFGGGFTTAELFMQHQYNSIRLLKRRFLTGGGPRFRVLGSDNLDVYVAPLIMFEQELLNDADNQKTNKFKGDLYVSLAYSMDERIILSHTTYYQPDLSVLREYRVASETGLEMKFNDNFSFLVTYNLSYDSDPPLDIPELFYTLKNGIKYNF